MQTEKQKWCTHYKMDHPTKHYGPFNGVQKFNPMRACSHTNQHASRSGKWDTFCHESSRTHDIHLQTQIESQE